LLFDKQVWMKFFIQISLGRSSASWRMEFIKVCQHLFKS
jgi:hypothetical protein